MLDYHDFWYVDRRHNHIQGMQNNKHVISQKLDVRLS